MEYFVKVSFDHPLPLDESMYEIFLSKDYPSFSYYVAHLNSLRLLSIMYRQ